MNRRGTSRTGFTLIEVLLAVMIAGIGLTVLVVAASKCLAVARLSKNYENARHFLDWVGAEYPIDVKTVEAGTDEGECEGPPDGYRWHREIVALGDEEDGFYLVRTRIVWARRGSNAYEEVATYLYAPKEEDEDT